MAPEATVFELRLFVAGTGPQSMRAELHARRFCETHLPGRYTLDVVDVTRHPRLARDEGLVALPVLIRRRPLPMRYLVGDMSDTAAALVGLDLVGVPDLTTGAGWVSGASLDTLGAAELDPEPRAAED